ncbi:MAG: sigma-54-dependent Fis family transcriptional regulator [Candidatus Brocadiae bacterium]|nr:sigma-54-dependent Fis family transcriptional regulator [Candidatus Brocadiia bacterium]
MARILIVDDEETIRRTVAQTLSAEKHECTGVGSGKEGLEALEGGGFDLVLLDLKMPGMDGRELLAAIRERGLEIPALMMSGHGTIEDAVEATRKGALDFIQKPFDRDRLLLAVRNAVSHGSLVAENRVLRSRIPTRTRMLGESEAIRAVRALVTRVAATDARVLVSGENGSGKELVARLIHEQSPRADRPFVDVNCAALPDTLIESELFGYEPGAFTGAARSTPGKFEQARGGTLFLDEIGDMPLSAQAKVLRVLEERQVRRLGGQKTIAVDCRVVAATNRDLAGMIARGAFREDLFYRLNVFPVRVPPLRERRADIPVLARHFLAEFCAGSGLPARRLDPGAETRLAGHAWPGNVRELKNVVDRLAILADREEIGAGDVERAMEGPGAAVPSAGGGGGGGVADLVRSCRTYEEFKEMSERMFLEARLKANDGNVSKTAEELDMPRSNFYKKMEKYGLK